MDLKIYKINKFVEKVYKDSVKDNSKLDHETIRKKFTRNIYLANELPSISRFIKIYQYGNLIIITRMNRIIWIHNIEGYIKFLPDEYRKKIK